MDVSRTRVVVAGAGPVGSVAAYYLASRNIDVVLLESGSDNAQDLRASTFHPPTLEMLEELDIADKLIEKGLKAPVFHFRERPTGEVIDFDLSELSDVTKFPFRIQCEQYHLSRMLSDAVLNTPNASIRFNHRIVGFHQNNDEIEVYAETPQEIVQINADYLIGADGANSIIRKWLETEFIGFTYPEKFLCFSTDTAIDEKIPNLSHVNYVSDPDEWMVLLRVPSLWRILLPADSCQPNAELLSDDKKNAVFDRLIGSGEEVETKHRTIYQVHQRVAKKFVHGRVIIIGDAAHLNNPIGGFGMNSGIHDAFNLCDKLIKIYAGGDRDTLMGKFERQRHKTTHDFIQAQTIQNMEYLNQGVDSQHEVRKAEMLKNHDDPELRRRYLLRQSMMESIANEKMIS